MIYYSIVYVYVYIYIYIYEKPIWEYNGKYYLEIHAVQVKGAQVENVFKNDVPYIMDLSFSKYDIQKKR